MLLMTGVGYAVETDQILKINDKASFSLDQPEFKVTFIEEPTYIGNGVATVKLIGETKATMKITELDSVGDYVTIMFTIGNKSNNIYADIDTSVLNTNLEYFRVTSKLSDTIINPKKGKAVLKITVELIKLPINKEQKTDISISISANPRYDN